MRKSRNTYVYSRIGYDKNRRPKNKKFIPKLSIFVMIIIGLSTALWIFNKPVDENTAQSAQSTNTTEIDPLETQIVNAVPDYDFSSVIFPSEGQAAIGTLSSGALQASSNIEYPSPMASMTKVITALAILKKAPITEGEFGDVITLNSQDEEYYHEYVAKLGTITPVTAGLQMTEYEALQAMLLPSSNNMADSMVDRYFGSREEYLEFANGMLLEFGLKNTVVADASGFNPGSVSTPSEMIVIGQKALQNKIISKIVAQPNAVISVAGEIPNYNPLISIPGVTGIKPGVTDEAGLCLLFSADTTDKEGKTVTIIGIVMGLENRGIYINGSKSMLDQARAIVSQ